MDKVKKIAYVVTDWMIIPMEFVVGKDYPIDLFTRAGVVFNNLERELIVVTDDRGGYLPAVDVFVREGGYYQKIFNPANMPKGEIRKLPEKREAVGHSEDEPEGKD